MLREGWVSRFCSYEELEQKSMSYEVMDGQRPVVCGSSAILPACTQAAADLGWSGARWKSRANVKYKGLKYL